MKQALGERVQGRARLEAADRQRRLPGDRRHDGPHAGEAAVAPEGFGCLGVSAPILEINPGHPLIAALARTVKAKGATSVEDASQLLLDQAFVIEGEQVPDPADFARRLAEVMSKVFA